MELGPLAVPHPTYIVRPAIHPQWKQNRVYSLNAVHLIGAHSKIQIYMRTGDERMALVHFSGQKSVVPDENWLDVLIQI